jgi:MYXO-CTERM domain-containing protein
MDRNLFATGVVALTTATLCSAVAHAITVQPPFDADYTATDLGAVPGLPDPYGGLLFLDDDTILIGGAANLLEGRFYTIDVTRDMDNRVNGFVGTATLYRGGSLGDYNDGGVQFAPNGTLLMARWPVNQLGQALPGSTDEDRILDLGPLGFPGGGGFRMASWEGGEYYEATLVDDGFGTFDLTDITRIDLDPSTMAIDNLPGGPEGIIYVVGGNPGFPVNSMLVSDYSADRISAYEVDSRGNPLVATRRDFITGLLGPEGAAIDPVTGDFLFSTFLVAGSQIIRVSGFTDPLPTPAPPLAALFGLGALALVRRR